MKKFLVVALIGLFSLSLTMAAFAEDCATGAGKSVTGFLKKTFKAPENAVKSTAGMTANTLNNTGEKVVAKTGENTAAVLQGDVAKTGDLVKDNVTGAATTAGQTVAETAQVPAKTADVEAAPAAPATK